MKRLINENSEICIDVQENPDGTAAVIVTARSKDAKTHEAIKSVLNKIDQPHYQVEWKDDD
jgi:hypothetical protein